MREIKRCTYRKPDLTDVADIYKCILPYASETWQGKQAAVCEATIRESLCNVIMATNFVAVIAEYEGEIVGLAFGYFGKSWWANPDGGVDMFYVGTEYRGTDAARCMLTELIRQFKAADCGYLYAGAESDIGVKNTTVYENLFKKFGFRDIGGGRMVLNLRNIGG